MADTGSAREVGQGHGQFGGNHARQHFGIWRRHCSRREGQRFDVFVDRKIFQSELFEALRQVRGFGKELERCGQGRSERAQGKGVHRGRLIACGVYFVRRELRLQPSADGVDRNQHCDAPLEQSGSCRSAKSGIV